MMNINENPGNLKLRGHHVYCLRFLTVGFEDRGSKFYEVEGKIKRILDSQPDSTIEIIEGVDELCKECPLCIEDRCTSSEGDEREVRKWDAIILKELGLSFGSVLTAGELQKLAKERSPLNLCQRCNWREVCSRGSDY